MKKNNLETEKYEVNLLSSNELNNISGGQDETTKGVWSFIGYVIGAFIASKHVPSD